ncbi:MULTISPECIES: permease [Halomicrobium]|uniref:Permease n=2 Tax=Halomicrobium mukohataei TaxID=57705 RepID=C7P140_HALMD|nr:MULTISPECIES: permease [Halomicrobium]ACV49055.1 permease [Halomicrobium mukohataei DSM 12286]QCD64475.1 permease [Halomicrobium mukohataei]QFR19281.1 permease [Halomicrobium sp. ZPS1]
MYIDTLRTAVALTAEMAWDSWWALVLGLTLSGAVEVFVDRQTMTAVLGGDGVREVSLGALFGAASSSCSYSAVGTTKTLFKKGASAPASLGAFMFASTDLVIELGLAMWVLLGWQFVVGEYLGGVVAVVVMVLAFTHVVPEAWIERARAHVRRNDEETCPTCDATITDPENATRERVGGDLGTYCCGGCLQVARAQSDDEGGAVLTVQSLRSVARATIKDWEMIGRDLVLGFVIAGVVGAAVPQAWWTALFGSQSTFVGVLTNTVVAVLIGILTFMCSVGNVPFALVLWRNGLPFGGVLSFIYADLLIPPLLSLYRRYYGWRMAATLFVTLATAAIVAGVVSHYVLNGLGIVPRQGTVGGTLSGEYTTILNLVFTPIFLAEVVGAYGRETVADRLSDGVSAIRSVVQFATVALSVAYLAFVFGLFAIGGWLSAARTRVRTHTDTADTAGLETLPTPLHDDDRWTRLSAYLERGWALLRRAIVPLTVVARRLWLLVVSAAARLGRWWRWLTHRFRNALERRS